MDPTTDLVSNLKSAILSMARAGFGVALIFGVSLDPNEIGALILFIESMLAVGYTVLAVMERRRIPQP